MQFRIKKRFNIPADFLYPVFANPEIPEYFLPFLAASLSVVPLQVRIRGLIPESGFNRENALENILGGSNALSGFKIKGKTENPGPG